MAIKIMFKINFKNNIYCNLKMLGHRQIHTAEIGMFQYFPPKSVCISKYGGWFVMLELYESC